jgi:REP element-mobilizing transposase RayT
MTQARSTLIPPGHAVFVHVTTRCVRRAWLFGYDRLSNRRYDHRCGLIESRVRELAESFAVGVYAFAWMSNHFHLALAVRPDAVRAWSDDEVVDRWQRIYRSKCERANAERRAQMLADPLRMLQIRERLASLSWFMKCLNEHVSRIANQEDQAHGHFWEARFKSQVLLDERALLAAMAYVDLNPIRAGIACNLMGSRNTSIRRRCKAVRGNPELAGALVRPIWGVAATTMPPVTVGEYIELVDDTGRQVRKDKRGAIPAGEPKALKKLGLSPDHWTRQVKGVGSGFWRVVGAAEAIEEKAVAMQQQFLRGIGFARALATG